MQIKSVVEAREYLETVGTCKCGLECPLRVDTVFDFSIQVPQLTKLINNATAFDGENQCCGFKYIEFRSGSRILAQFGSGSRILAQFGSGSRVIPVLSILKEKI